jgi:alpha-glucosidase
MINTRDSEPWSYGEEVEQIARNFIKFRYQLMPYIYSLFHEASTTGKPVQRSLALEYPFVEQVYNHTYHNQYLFGPSILVAPIESNKELMKVYLPAGEWYYLYTGQKYLGDQEIFLDCPIHRLPVFIKGGALLPMKKSGINTKSEGADFILHVYPGQVASEFLFYEDDGETFAYQQGNFSKRTIRYNPGENKVVLGKSEGRFTSSYNSLTVVIHGSMNIQAMSIHQQPVPTERTEFSFFTPLEKYDPINDPESMGSELVVMGRASYTSEEITVSWSF